MNRSEGENYSEDRVEREREREKLDGSNKKQEHRIRKLETKAVQNVNLYLIFQAVILASSTTSTSCHNSWIPISLSLIAAITNFLTLFAHVSKILKSREQLDQNLSDLAFITSHKLTRDQINQHLPGATFSHQGGEIVRPDAAAGSIKKWKRRLVVYLSVALFAGFSAIVMYGCHRVLLCHPGGRNCVKLC